MHATNRAKYQPSYPATVLAIVMTRVTPRTQFKSCMNALGVKNLFLIGFKGPHKSEVVDIAAKQHLLYMRAVHWQQLWLHAQDLYKIKPAKILVWMGEGAHEVPPPAEEPAGNESVSLGCSSWKLACVRVDSHLPIHMLAALKWLGNVFKYMRLGRKCSKEIT